MNRTAASAKRTRVQPTDLAVGRPLPYDIEDAYGHLLLRQGHPIRSEEQRRRLLQIGRTPYYATPDKRGSGGVQRRRETDPLSANPFDEIYRISFALQETFKWLGQRSGRFLSRLDTLTSRIGDLVERDPDASIGAAHLDEDFPYTVRHPIRQAILCDTVATQLGIPATERRSTVCAALTANVGMLELQRELERQVEPLSDEQLHAVRRHPTESARMLAAEGITDGTWLRIVAEHQERLDGSGYPEGLQGGQICRGARLLMIADTYMAMISTRSYRPATAVRETLLELLNQSGTVYDREMLSGFINTIGIYPPGSFVSLSNGERGVVVHRGERGEQPLVAAIVKANGQPTARPLHRDTSHGEAPDVVALEPTLTVAKRFNLGSLWGYGT
ncbi:HD-GYP domain-containing protein [Halorhodospira neutriphila]|nr:HD domain-containing phosphohydrolase [Halorhodospira neutriphila]